MTPETGQRGEVVRSRSRRRPAVTIAAAVLGVVLLAAGSAAAGLLWPRSGPESAAPVDPETATIQRGDLRAETLARGTLTYRPIRAVEAGRDGIVTSLPAVGDTIQPGGPLLWVNNLPTFLFAGDTPAWRAFEPDISDGPDVLQLEQNLAAGGFLGEAPDSRFDGDTSLAIERWQRAHGLEQTGTIQLGQVVFRPGALRVATREVSVGDSVSSTSKALDVTSFQREVQVQLPGAQLVAAPVGTATRISLVDSDDTVDGVVREVGSRTKDQATGEYRYPVVIDLDQSSTLPEGDDIAVRVTFLGEERKDVLSVPLGAITAIDSKTFGVQVLGKNKTVATVPVTLGVISAGMVEIAGEGLAEGMTVLVAGS